MRGVSQAGHTKDGGPHSTRSATDSAVLGWMRRQPLHSLHPVHVQPYLQPDSLDAGHEAASPSHMPSIWRFSRFKQSKTQTFHGCVTQLI